MVVINFKIAACSCESVREDSKENDILFFQFLHDISVSNLATNIHQKITWLYNVCQIAKFVRCPLFCKQQLFLGYF